MEWVLHTFGFLPYLSYAEEILILMSGHTMDSEAINVKLEMDSQFHNK